MSYKGYDAGSYRSPLGPKDSLTGMYKVRVSHDSRYGLSAYNCEDCQSLKMDDIVEAVKKGDPSMAIDGKSLEYLIAKGLIEKAEALTYMQAANKRMTNEIAAGNDPDNTLREVQQSFAQLAKSPGRAQREGQEVAQALGQAQRRTSNLTGVSLG